MATILIVDDMAVFREPMSAALREQGYRTVSASDGQTALQRVRAEQPDLMLLDLAMPGMNGLDMLEQLRDDPDQADLPVIAVTALGQRDYILRLGKLGVRDCLLKSNFHLDDLLERIDRHLAHRTNGHGPNGSRKDGAAERSAARAAQGAGGANDGGGDSGDGDREEADAPTAAASSGGRGGGADTAGSTDTKAAAPAPPGLPNLDNYSSSAEALKAIKPIVTRSQITEKVEEGGELRALSPTVSQVMKQTASADCSIEQVARTIKQDQAIALKVLKLANSAVYTRGEPADSVHKAVMRIGISQIRQTVMNISVIDRFANSTLEEQLDSKLFWEHSIATGLIAAELTRALGGKDPEIDTAFTMGLLHDIGRVVYAEQFPDEYTKVLQVADKLDLPLERVESRMLLMNHADLMDKVLHAWKFPKELVNPVALHHLSLGNIRKMAPRSVGEVATLALANRLAHALLLGDSANNTIYPTEEYAKLLKVPAAELRRIIEDTPEQTDEVKFAMLQSGGDAWPDSTQRAREQLAGPLRPVILSAEPDLDAYRVIADQLTDPEAEAEGQPPNLAIAHLPDVNQRSPLTEQVRQREREAGIENLPAVLISPKGNIDLDPPAMEGRPVRRLCSPTTLPSLIGAINALLHEHAEQPHAEVA